MSSSTAPRILLTGATGFIGGSVLHSLLNSTSPALSSATVTLLLRGSERAASFKSTFGSRVDTVLYKDLDDLEATTAVAAEHDVVISTTQGFHIDSAQALLKGLGQRKKQTGRDVWMIHTTGTSNVADKPITKSWVDPEHPDGQEFDDAKDDVYGIEKQREAHTAYTQRTVSLSVVDTGLELGVKTLVIMSPLIFGIGSGLFSKTSAQVPIYLRAALLKGHPLVIGEGKGVWDHVHVQDLADLYKLVVLNILEHDGKDVPYGKKGYIFSANGRHTWMDVARLAGQTCLDAGKTKTSEVQHVGIADMVQVMVDIFGFGDETIAELGLASNAKTISTVGRSLGWKPVRGEEAFKQTFPDDLQALLEKDKA